MPPMRKENDYALWKNKRRPSHGFGKMCCQPDAVRGFIRRNDRRCSEYNDWHGGVLHLRLCRVQRSEHFRYCRSSLPFVVSITNISVQEAQQYFDRFDRYGHNQNELEETTSVGSGIIFEQTDDVLYIVTNYHVVEDATTLSVGFVDDEVYEAELCGTDEDNDLAVLKVSLDDLSADTRAAISVAVFGDSDSLRVGEQVVAIGNALGYGQSVTTGIVSALNRSISTGTDAQGNTVQSTYIQTDAAINPGNSGGALLNMDGEVIGINTAKLASTEVEGMGYAIPISDVTDIIDELKTQTTTQQKTTGQHDSTPMYYFFRF